MSLSLGVFLIFIRTDLVNFSYLHSAFSLLLGWLWRATMTWRT